MAEIVEIIGFTMQQSKTLAYFDVQFWARARGATGTSSVWYRNLSIHEAMDAIYASVEAHRPGQVEGEGGWIQPQLSGE